MHEWNSVKKTPGQQCYRLLDEVVTINKYKIITIDHAVYKKESTLEQCLFLRFLLTMLYTLLTTKRHNLLN